MPATFNGLKMDVNYPGDHNRLNRLRLKLRIRDKKPEPERDISLPTPGKEHSIGKVSILNWRHLFNGKVRVRALIFIVILLAFICANLFHANQNQREIIQALIQAHEERLKERMANQKWSHDVRKWVFGIMGLLKAWGLSIYLLVNPFGPVLLV